MHDYFFSTLHSSEQGDANCSSSTNALKIEIDFLDEPSEKSSDSEVVRFPPQHEDFIDGITTPDSSKCKCSAPLFIVLYPK